MSNGGRKKVELDTVDRRLLIELLRDSRVSLRRLSEEMSVSPLHSITGLPDLSRRE